jgi:glycosyltransferase involved in cell wall biosynthesis
MSIVIGHPTGNPNSFNAALAYWESGDLEAFCLPWLPRKNILSQIRRVPQLRPMIDRLHRRVFEPLAGAPLKQGRFAEWQRLVLRSLKPGRGTEQHCSEQATAWLVRTMITAVGGSSVTAVHAYEDCAVDVFNAATRMGRVRILEMPTCHSEHKYNADKNIARHYGKWLPSEWNRGASLERVAKKRDEIDQADLVLVACEFAASTIREHHPKVQFGFAPYGTDLDFWKPEDERTPRDRPLKAIFVGQLSPGKGVPYLIEAWRRASLPDAELCLVGNWGLSEDAGRYFPKSVTWAGALGPEDLRHQYQQADLMVFPSWYEGFGLVILEAMACGLPVICSRSTAGPELLTPECGWLHDAGDVNALVELLKRAGADREKLLGMGCKSRERARAFEWGAYRTKLLAATRAHCHPN